MKESVLYFLNSLEGYHSLLKTLHWSTKNKAMHLLTDEIDGAILDYEDRLAESMMGITDSRINVGELKTLLPESKDVSNMLKELKKDVLKLRKDIEGKEENAGMVNILEEFLESIDKWNYLKTFE